MPIITMQPDETDGMDTQIDQSNPTTNFGTNAQMAVGEFDTAAALYRSLIKFDLSVIPRSARIISAQLTLTIALDRSSNNRNFRVYRVMKDWVESQATWSIYSTGNNWALAGCSASNDDYDTTVWATVAMGTTDSGAKTWDLDVTEFTKIIDGTYPNYGWLIKADTENNDAYTFHTSASATASARPKLVVEYSTFGAAPMISPMMKM